MFFRIPQNVTFCEKSFSELLSLYFPAYIADLLLQSYNLFPQYFLFGISFLIRKLHISQDEIARIRKRKRGRNMLNRSGNTTDNLCFRYRFRDVFSRFRCCVYNGTGPLFVHVKHNGNMELLVSATFQKYGNMWFRPVFEQRHFVTYSIWRPFTFTVIYKNSAGSRI